MTREFRDKLNDDEVRSLRQSVLQWLTEDEQDNQPLKTTKQPATKPVPTRSELPKKQAIETQRTAHRQTRGGSGPKKIFKKSIITSICVLLGVLISYWIYLYFAKPTSDATLAITKIVPYPAAIVNNTVVSYYDWAYQVRTLEHFYEREAAENQDFEYPEPEVSRQHIMRRIIEQQAIENLAKDYNISVTEQELSNQLTQLIAEVGGEDNLKEQITELYDWSIEDFSVNVLQPLILKNKLQVALTADDRINEAARKEAERIRQQLLNNELTFTAAAAQFSQDVTALQGGDLGYFGRGEMVVGFETVAFSLPVGQISEVIRTQFGYHIIEVTERTLNDQEEVSQVRARHILIRSQDAEAIIDEAVENARVIYLIHIANKE